MSSRPPRGGDGFGLPDDPLDGDEPRFVDPFGEPEEDGFLPFDDESRPDPFAGMTPDERVEHTRQHMIDGSPERAQYWNSEEGDEFLRRMDAIEHGPYISTFRMLIRGGAKLPSPESIPDEEITCALWAVIGELAARRVFLSSTDHLSDRELYEHLWFDVLREEMPDFKGKIDINSSWNIDILGACTEEDIRMSLTYFYDDESRAQWQKDFPEYDMPPKLPRPFDRDRFMPRPEDAWKALSEEEANELSDLPRLEDDENRGDDIPF